MNLKPKFLRTFSEKNLQANLRNMSTVKPAQMMVEVATVLANSGTDSVSTARILELFGQCLSVTATATEQSKCAPTPQDLKILNITNNIKRLTFPKYWCTTCNIDLQSEISLKEHYRGRRHIRKTLKPEHCNKGYSRVNPDTSEMVCVSCQRRHFWHQ